MKNATLLSACLTMLSLAPLTAQEDREIFETEIDADIESVWEAFSTAEGLTKWMAPLADIELKIGGKMRANYIAEGKLGDENTIENTILAYDPKRMISYKATKFPAGFPFAEAAKATWSVFYFTELPASKTRITIVGLGYTDAEDSKRMRSFFKTANQQVIGQLAAALKNDPAAPDSE